MKTKNRIKQKSLTLLFLSVISLFTVQAQNKILSVTLEGAVYDSLLFTGYDIDQNKIILPGVKDAGCHWKFTIPDHVWKVLPSFGLYMWPYNETTNSVGYISFVCEGDSLNKRVSVFSPDEENLRIKARFRSQIKDKGNFSVKGGKTGEFVSVAGEIIEDVFDLDGNAHKQLMFDPEFSLRNLDEPQYEQEIKRLSGLIELYPNSRKLMVLLKRRYSSFRSEKELEALCNKFSDNLKQSFWGREIYRQIYTKQFENSSLPLWNDTLRENIIQDHTRYNLILFSASWCGPCRREIPLLKKLYRDLNKSIEFTYVSIDDSRSVENWRKLMVDEKIPWRSLVCYQDVRSVMTKYFLSGPSTILVSPDGSIEKIDTAKESDIKKLYDLHL